MLLLLPVGWLRRMDPPRCKASSRTPAARALRPRDHHVTDPAAASICRPSTDAQGTFIFGMLPPGHYDVSASAPGMASKTSRGVELFVGGVSVVHLRLAPAAPTQTITVTRHTGHGGDAEQRRLECGDATGHPGFAAERTPLHRSGVAFPGSDPGPARPDLRLQRRPVVRRNSGISEQFPGRRHRRQQFLLCSGPWPLSRALSIQQRSHQGISRLVQLLQRGIGTARAAPCSMWPPSRAPINGTAAASTICAIAISTRNRPMPPASLTIASNSSAAHWEGRSAKTAIFFYAGFDQHLLTVPHLQFANGASSVVPQPADYDYTDQATGLRSGTEPEQHGRHLSHHHAGQRRIRQSRLQSLAEATGVSCVSAPRASAEPTTFSSIPPVPSPAMRKAAMEREDVQTESVAASLDQRLDQQSGHQLCACNSRATRSIPPPTPTSPGPRSTT